MPYIRGRNVNKLRYGVRCMSTYCRDADVMAVMLGSSLGGRPTAHSAAQREKTDRGRLETAFRSFAGVTSGRPLRFKLRAVRCQLLGVRVSPPPLDDDLKGRCACVKSPMTFASAHLH